MINVVDANGNYRTIGTVSTDVYGQYSLSWTPDITGDYSVIATFAGTNGYWPSSAKTSFTVDEAAATPTPVPTALHQWLTCTSSGNHRRNRRHNRCRRSTSSARNKKAIKNQ
jgi:hypothetical protein